MLQKPALNKLIADLEKKGIETVDLDNYKIDFVSTGILGLDLALGGGLARGRISEFAGWQQTGKTSHAFMLAKNVQRAGGVVAYIDLEYTFSPAWAKQSGMDLSPDKFLIFRGYDLETVGDAIIEISNAGVDLIILDSVGAAPIKALNEGELGDSNMGRVAKIMSDMLRKIAGPIARNNTLMLFINQLRESLNMYSPAPVTPGGKALPFFATSRVQFSAKPEKSYPPQYTTITAHVIKNKLAPPGRKAEYDFDFAAASVNPVTTLVDVLTNKTFMEDLDIKVAGAWYTLPEELAPDIENRRFNGAAKLQEYFADVESLERAEKYVISKLLPTT
jgi:recombination protein RecA